MGDRRSTKIAKMMVLCWHLTFLPPRSNLLPHAFVWVIHIYIESIDVTCRSADCKSKMAIILFIFIIFPCHCVVYMYKIMILQKNHLASFHQISHWSYCWNVIDSLFKWSCSIDCRAHIFFCFSWSGTRHWASMRGRADMGQEQTDVF